MNANDVMVEALDKTIKEMKKGNDNYINGFNQAVNFLRRLMESGTDSSILIPIANKKSYETFNHVEDLKDDGMDASVVDIALGLYEAFENFLTNFKVWLREQDVDTILIHTVNNEIEIRDEVEPPMLDTLEKRFQWNMSEFMLGHYEVDNKGNITHVTVIVHAFMKENEYHKFTYEEFHKLFDVEFFLKFDVSKEEN